MTGTARALRRSREFQCGGRRSPVLLHVSPDVAQWTRRASQLLPMLDPVRDSPTSPNSAGGSAVPPAEAVIARCLAVSEGDRARAIEDEIARLPEIADELRARLEVLRAFGFGLPGSTPDFPEQLGDFRLIERLGGGGMGVVFRAEQTSLKREVALKLIRPEQLYFAGSRERFRREVDAVARLQHSGIVPIFAVGEERGIPFFAMERIRGCTLAEAMRALRGRAPESLKGADLHGVVAAAAESNGSLPEGSAFDGTWIETCLRLARQVAEALEHAHERGLVHRDVKPSNIALTPDGRAMLFDFGLVRADEAGDLTRTGSTLGTIHYMSPEQMRGGKEVDRRSDVYSLGVTLYEMLALQLPHRGESQHEIERAIEVGPDPIRARNPRVETDVETVVLRALDRDPGRRYPRATDLARDLGHLLAKRPIEAQRPGPLLRCRRWMQRKPVAATALVVGPALLLFGGVATLLRERSHSRDLGERLEETRKARDESERQKANVLRLSAFQELHELEEEADRLWPASPELLPALRSWMDRAQALVLEIPRHLATLEEIRARARPLPEQGPKERTSWEFDQAEDSWWHGQLSKLVTELEQLRDEKRGGLLSTGTSAEHGWGIAKRAEYAGSIAERSISGPEARRRWEAAVATIAVNPRYGGLSITPQLGLLPIGEDPSSHLSEFAELGTGDPPERGVDGKLALKASTGLVFVLIPGGTFRMGAQRQEPEGANYDPQAEEDESPVHEVELSPYFLSKYEMTQGQWERVTGANPSRYVAPFETIWNREGKGWSALHPVESVTWAECMKAMGRLGLALPSEAQWENGTRGGTASVYWTGADLASLEGAANLADAFAKSHGGEGWETWEKNLDDGNSVTAAVGSYRANGFGLHDVHGNVWEWCLDGYDTDFYAKSPGLDPVAASAGNPNRALRGGSFMHGSIYARSSMRTPESTASRRTTVGLRPARAVTSP